MAVDFSRVVLQDKDTGEVLANLPMVPGERVYDTFDRAGLRLPTRCQGSAICGLCRVEVVSGRPLPEQPTADEAELLARVAPDEPHARLACQLRAAGGSLIVAMAGARWPHRG